MTQSMIVVPETDGNDKQMINDPSRLSIRKHGPCSTLMQTLDVDNGTHQAYMGKAYMGKACGPSEIYSNREYAVMVNIMVISSRIL